MHGLPLWKVHLVDELSVMVERQLVEDVGWALDQGFDQDAIRQALQVATDTCLTLRQVLEQDFSDLQLADELRRANDRFVGGER